MDSERAGDPVIDYVSTDSSWSDSPESDTVPQVGSIVPASFFCHAGLRSSRVRQWTLARIYNYGNLAAHLRGAVLPGMTISTPATPSSAYTIVYFRQSPRPDFPAAIFRLRFTGVLAVSGQNDRPTHCPGSSKGNITLLPALIDPPIRLSVGRLSPTHSGCRLRVIPASVPEFLPFLQR